MLEISDPSRRSRKPQKNGKTGKIYTLRVLLKPEPLFFLMLFRGENRSSRAKKGSSIERYIKKTVDLEVFVYVKI